MEARLPIFYQTQVTKYVGKMVPPYTPSGSSKCNGLEREFFTCLSNYGLDIGQEKCAAEKLNFQECKNQTKAKKRRMAMTAERYKQKKEPIPEGPAHLHATPYY